MTSTVELQVYRLLVARPMTPAAVAAELGIAYTAAQTAVRRLRDSGYVTLVERRGRYRVYATSDKALDIATVKVRSRRASKETVRVDGYGSGGKIALEEVW